MKKLAVIASALAAVFMAGTAMASGTNTLTVTASVTGTCKFVSATSTLDFGALDPSVGTDVNKSTTTAFWCTKGVTTDSITADNGSHANGTVKRLAGPGGDYIPYSLTLTKDALTNAGPGTPRTLTIAGTIAGTDYTGATSGNYSDSVVLSINP